MPVIYHFGPYPPVSPSAANLPSKIEVEIEGKKHEIDLRMLQGEGINAAPFESRKIMDLTFPPGKGSGIVYGICFQLGKWGYESVKIDHTIDVSPVFTEYYTKTMEEKRKIEAQIKNGFVSLREAITDFELLDHDVRKYREFMDRFKAVKDAEKKLEKAKTKEEKERAENELRRAQHVIKAMFVDEVDAHTGEAVALRNIAVRWPTIISDFFTLRDEDVTVEKVMKRANIPKPEAAILTTKNQLFVSWKKFFLDTIKERYERLRRLAAARKATIDEYRKEIRPLLSRYKALTEMRESSEGGKTLEKIAWYRPDAQAVSIDTTKIWAWRPFVVEEVFKAPRESYNPIDLRRAGFNEEEIKLLRENGIHSVPAMPAVPVMDRVIRDIMKQIEAPPPGGYGVKLTAVDVVNVIKDLNRRFAHPEFRKETAVGPKWPFSPYYVFILLDVTRTVVKLPDGSMLEDIWIEPMKAWNCSQNIMIGRLLEIEAKGRALEREISVLLGEIDPERLKAIDEIVREEEYPELYLEEGVKKKEEEGKKPSLFKRMSESITKFRENLTGVRRNVGKAFATLGLNFMFVYPGPYEKLMHERMTKMMQRGPGMAFNEVDAWLKKVAGVPGV